MSELTLAARVRQGALPLSVAAPRSFSFMAPEQVRGAASVDARADIYAIGALAFVALTGKLPFADTNALVGIARKVERPPPTLESAVGTPFSPLIELFVATAMASDREQRYSRIEVARAAWRNACEMAE